VKVRETALAVTRKAAGHMAERGIENARLEAELLMAAVLGVSRLDLYLQFDRPLNEQELTTYREHVKRRLKREPLQYIVGHVQFREIELNVDRRVLIPRPETEVLVGEVLTWAARHGAKRAIDLGTGSGAIALSLAKEGAFEQVVATDVSRDALKVAYGNADRLGLKDRIEWRHGSLWDVVRDGETFDVIVSNPPYVESTSATHLQPEVAEWEPAQALFAGPDGLDILRQIVTGAPDRLNRPGLLAVEIGAGQADAVKEIAERTGAFAAVQAVRDLSGRDRIISAEKI